MPVRNRGLAANLIGKRRARGALRDFRHRWLPVLEGICPSGFRFGPTRLWREPWWRGQFGARRRALRRLITLRHTPDDIGLDHDVGRPADHQEMFNVIPAHEHKPAAAIHRGGINHGKSRHASAIRTGADAAPAESANQPGSSSDQRENDDEGDEKPERLRHVTVPVKQHPLRMPDSRDVRRLSEECIVC
jgi:hypothetical protein